MAEVKITDLPVATTSDGTEPLPFVQAATTKQITVANLSTGIAGLTVPQGGTGAATLTSHGVLTGAGTGAIAPTAAGTNGQTLTGNTGAAPTWQTIQAATATDVASVRTVHVRYSAVAAPAGSAGACGIVVNVDVANGAQSVAAQVGCPRKLVLYVTDDDSSISAGTLDLVGVGASGEAVTDSLPLTGGTTTHATSHAYATLTSATVNNLVGAVAGDKIALGAGTALGLPGQKTPASSTFAVYKADVDNVNETVGTVDATAGTIVPNTTPNGTHNYDFWFNFTVTELQNSHTHTFA